MTYGLCGFEMSNFSGPTLLVLRSQITTSRLSLERSDRPVSGYRFEPADELVGPRHLLGPRLAVRAGVQLGLEAGQLALVEAGVGRRIGLVRTCSWKIRSKIWLIAVSCGLAAACAVAAKATAGCANALTKETPTAALAVERN